MVATSVMTDAGRIYCRAFRPFQSGSSTSVSAGCLIPQRLVLKKRKTVNIGRFPVSVNAQAEPQAEPQASATTPAPAPAPSKPYIEDNAFRIEKVSFGSILTPIGVSLMVYGFGAFFQLLPGANVSAILLIYGFPISLLGFALSYAQLQPVPCRTTEEAMALRDSQATNIQKQVREDVTRFRYGDEQHLDEALNRIFMFNRPKGIPRRLSPKLVAIREDVVDGNYSLVLEFATKPEMTVEMWETRLPKFTSFFGPGIVASLQPKEQGMDLSLTVDGSGAGRGDAAQQEVLPPLMPGLKPRVKQ